MIGFQKQVEILLLAQLDRHTIDISSYCRISEASSSSFFSVFGFRYIYSLTFYLLCFDTRHIKYLATLWMDSIYRVWAVFRAIDSHHKKGQSCIDWPFPLPARVGIIYCGCWPARNSRRGQTTTANARRSYSLASKCTYIEASLYLNEKQKFRL